jgi:hypothetical protein
MSQVKVRSTTQRLGSTTKVLWPSSLGTITSSSACSSSDVFEPALVARIREDRQQLGIVRLGHLLQDFPPAIAVLHTGRGDYDREDQPEGVR